MIIKLFLWIINKFIGLDEIPPDAKEKIRKASGEIVEELVKAGVAGAVEGIKKQ